MDQPKSALPAVPTTSDLVSPRKHRLTQSKQKIRPEANQDLSHKKTQPNASSKA